MRKNKLNKSKLILGIETSCDETAASLIRMDKKKITVLANLVYSQIKEHEPFGGVVPEVAARKHLEILPRLLDRSRKKIRLDFKGVDYIAVTVGPGLVTSLMVGVDTAKTLALMYNKPLIPVNHLSGHIMSALLPNGKSGEIKKISWPALALVVSGGHTELVLVKDYTAFSKVGGTVDDAAGESFDKVAKMLKLGYPGGPFIEQAARKGEAGRYNFPRPMSNQWENLNYSFSGLKTAVRVLLAKKTEQTPSFKADIAAAFQEAVVDSLLIKLELAIEKYQPKYILLGGGVADNKLLRRGFAALARKHKLPFYMAQAKYTQDNAVMIAHMGLLMEKDAILPKRLAQITANPNLGYD